MIFSHSPIIRNMEIDLFIDNNNQDQNNENFRHRIVQVSPNSANPTIKFLGVLLDPELSFKPHIEHVNEQLSKGLFFLRTAKNLFSKHCLLSIYFTLIHSHLTYALPIWSCAQDSMLKNLFIKQKTPC